MHTPCWSPLHFSSNLIFVGYTGSKNPVWTGKKFQLVLKSIFISVWNKCPISDIFQKTSTDQQGVRRLLSNLFSKKLQHIVDSCDLFVFVWSFKNYHCCRVAKFILLRFINCHPLTCRSSTVELTVYLHQSQNRHLLFASCQLPMFIYLVTNETNKLCICCTMSIVDEPS